MNNRVSSRSVFGAVAALVALLCLLINPVRAELASETTKSGEAPAAMAWLERLGPALNMTSYRGVFVYARGEQVHSMRIAHRYRNGR
ncbi:MAG TPA: transcriptional regulator, partial [Marinobacter hydrocarbonoclasticus]|nr:transcriptional regulator [Marinobacter nauticus]